MFFREKRSPNAKKPILQLVENIRTVNGPRQRLIVSLGTRLEIPKKDRSAVARLVQEQLQGQSNLFGHDPGLLSYADKVVKKIQTEGKWSSTCSNFEATFNDTANIFVDQVNHGHDRRVGPLLVGHTFWERLHFPQILSGCGFSADQVTNAELSILHRLISPGSEFSIPGWLKTVAAADLIDHRAEEFAEDRFYRISDKLLGHQEELEQKLYDREKSLFNLNNAIYLFDLTNTYFEGLCASNPKAEFNGNQKEKRTDCRQVVAGLVLDQEGFIRQHRVFNGKMSDVDSLKKILESLKQDIERHGFVSENKPTIIFDRGVMCDENLALIKPYFHYVLASRVNEEKDFLDDFGSDGFNLLSGRDRAGQSQVQIKLKREGDEVFLLCKSDGRYNKETGMRNRAEQKLEADLQSLANRIEKDRLIDPVKVEQTIGRYRERHSRVIAYYEIVYRRLHFDFVLPSEGLSSKRLTRSLLKLKEKYEANKIGYHKLQAKLAELAKKYPADYGAISIELTGPCLNWQTFDEKRAKAATLDGNYLLKTDRRDMSAEEMWRLYMMLTRVEKGFRNLKSDLGLRPNNHEKEDRVDGHIFITILAYHLLHSVEHTLRQKNISTSWATIKRVLSSHTYSTIYLPTVKGPVINLRKAGIPEGVHLNIYHKLGIDYANLPLTKIIA